MLRTLILLLLATSSTYSRRPHFDFDSNAFFPQLEGESGNGRNPLDVISEVRVNSNSNSNSNSDIPTRKPWKGPIHVPVIGAYGVPTETPEVEVERDMQLEALRVAYATAEPEKDYDKEWDGIGEPLMPVESGNIPQKFDQTYMINSQ